MLSESHRSSVEYVTSLARIYQTAEASDIALSELYERLLRSVRSRAVGGSVRELMDECESKKYKKLSEKELLELSRRIALAQRPTEGG